MAPVPGSYHGKHHRQIALKSDIPSLNPPVKPDRLPSMLLSTHCARSRVADSRNQKRILSSFAGRLASDRLSGGRVGTGDGGTDNGSGAGPGGATVRACFTPVVNSCLANGGRGRRTNSLGRWREQLGRPAEHNQPSHAKRPTVHIETETEMGEGERQTYRRGTEKLRATHLGGGRRQRVAALADGT